MITVGTRVCITDFADFFLQEGIVKKIKRKGNSKVSPQGRRTYFIACEGHLEEVEKFSWKSEKE